MRAHHVIDVADGNAGGVERPQIDVVGFHIPFRTRRPRLVVADAAVDQDGMMRRLHDVGLEAQDQYVVVVERVRAPHPRPVLCEPLRRKAGQQIQCRQECGFLLDDAMNGEIAGGEFEAHGIPALRRRRHRDLHRRPLQHLLIEGVEFWVGLAPAAIGKAEVGIAEHANKSDLHDVERPDSTSLVLNRAMPLQALFQ